MSLGVLYKLIHKLNMHKANFAKNMEVCETRDVLNGLDSSKFSEILYSNTTPDKFSIYLVKITFKHLSFVRKAYLNGRKRQNPPGYCSFKFLIFPVYSRL